ncbi:MAG TPA: hypothetical protein PLO69_11185 [Gammaproteobacteria bacterium]|nr:hypothetical protein [Gammaproteobacteria bacterium]
MSFQLWIGQKTTILGIAAEVGDIVHLAAQYLTGSVDMPTAIAIAAAGAVALVVNERGSTAADILKVAKDFTAMAVSHTLDTSVAVTDAMAVMADIQKGGISVNPALSGTAAPAATGVADAVPSAAGLVANAAVAAVRSAGPVALAGLIVASLGACTQQQMTQNLRVACQIDGTLQPIAALTLAALVPQSSGVVSIDAAAVHPAVVAYCATLHGKPTTMTQTAATAAVVAAASAPVPVAPVSAAPAAAAH